VSRESVYRKVLYDAAHIANTDDRLPEYLKNMFRPPAHGRELLLHFDPTIRTAIATMQQRGVELRTEEEIWASVQTVVRDAIKRAITPHLGALVEEGLRSGNSPEDWFNVT
jgi:hypothetical protein